METVEQGNEKTFTQAEVDAIVGDRLKRDRAKYADYEDLKAKADKFDDLEEANKSELQKVMDRAKELEQELDVMKRSNTVREIRDKVATETGIPAKLLTGDTEEACREQAEAIKAFAKPSGYPNVRDAGEANGTPKGTTRQQFADWASKAFG